MEKKLTVILIGGGNRGETYTDIMAKMPEKYQLVAVAEPIVSRREQLRQKHALPRDRCFAWGAELLKLGRIADAAVIATMDRDHFSVTMEAIALGYDILLEKPVSPDPVECLRIAEYAREKGVRIVVCHVLRYTPFFMTLKELISSGRIGECVSINHEECVGNVHQSHSFVRGNWGNTGRSSFMLLQKSCHDMDILQWLLDKPCKKVQSFGSLRYFVEKNAPQGAPEYCIQGCPEGERCPYNAVKLYLDDKQNDWFRTTCTRQANPTDEMVLQSLRTTQYGKCVFRCDNDVVDHQTVNLLFEGDVTVTFTMNAFNKGGRFIHIMGTAGELRGAMDGSSPITLYDFATRQTQQVSVAASGGHGGGDEGIVESFREYLLGEYRGNSVSDIATSVDNHLIAFAAEQARLQGTVVDLEEYRKSLICALREKID